MMVKYFVAVFIVLSSFQILPQKWVQINGPFGGRFTDQLSLNDTFYFSTSNGIYRSVDQGNSLEEWGLQRSSIKHVGSDYSYVFAVDLFRRLLRRKINNGVWELINNPSATEIRSIKGHPKGYVYLGTYRSGIFRSSDHGNSWQLVYGPSGAISNILISDSSDIFIAEDFYAIFRSTDYGETWVKKSEGLNWASGYGFLIEDSRGYLYTSKYEHYVSTNRGTDWTLTSFPGNILFRGRNLIYASGGSGFYFSSDGTEWTRSGALIMAMYTLTENIFGDILAGTWRGMYRSSDKGAHFDRIGLPVVRVQAIQVDSSGYHFAGGSGFYKSDSLGEKWFDYDLNYGDVLRIFKSKNNILLAAVQGNGVFRHWDRWQYCYLQNEAPTVWDIAEGYADTFYCITDNKLFKGVNKGWHWYQINAPVSNSRFSAVAASDKKLFIGTMSDGVFISDDEGLNWRSAADGLTGLKINFLMLNHAEKLIAATDSGIYILSSDQDSWVDFNSPGTLTRVNYLLKTNNDIYAAAKNGVHQYNSRNKMWTAVNDGLKDNEILSLALDNNEHLLAGTSHGSVYKLKPGIISSAEDISPDMNFELMQNYPNPFNSSSVIRYSVKEYGQVSLKIFDILGKEIKTLINEEKPAGTYEITWNAENLPGGVYFCRLRSGNKMEVKKMVLLR